MSDIIFQTDKYVFSYRAAGICIQDGKVLLQKPYDDDDFAFPGGQVAFGETNEETLIREFKEEIGADISVGELKWAGEIFFKWGEKPCHQICLYYSVTLENDNFPKSSSFLSKEVINGKKSNIEFYWIPINKTSEIKVYPENAAELLKNNSNDVKHFVYKE